MNQENCKNNSLAPIGGCKFGILFVVHILILYTREGTIK